MLSGVGIVTARDFTHDPKGGLDCNWLAARLVASGDPRIKYVIWNRRIWTAKSGWVAYKGTNPHDHHLHLSVSEQPGWFDSTLPWAAVTSSGVGSPITTLPASPTVEDDMPVSPSFESDLWKTLGRMENTITATNERLQRLEAEVAATRGAAEYGAQGAAGLPTGDGRQSPLAALVTGGKFDGQFRPAAVTATVNVGAADIAKSVADELDRRARDGDPKTGPTS